MAIIRSLRVTLPPSASPDVVGYRMRIAESPALPTVDTPFVELGADPTDIDLASLPGIGDLDGVYNMAFSAVDDAGNESDLVVARDKALDFLAPNAPGVPEFSN